MKNIEIKEIILKTKKEIFSNLTGFNATNIKGEGYDFSELKEYDFESDAKNIDWLISAKMQKPYVRVYQEEKRRNIVAIFLLSGSLYFGSKRLKIETLLEAFAIFGFSAIKFKENFQHAYIYKNKINLSNSYKNIYDVEKNILNISTIDLIGLKPDFKDINNLFYKIKEKSLIIFFGDFLYDIDLTLFSKKHEIIALISRDSIEKNFSNSIEIELLDNEKLSSRSLLLNKKNLSIYKKNIENILKRNYLNFKKNGIDYIEIFDNDNIFLKLYNHFLGK